MRLFKVNKGLLSVFMPFILLFAAGNAVGARIPTEVMVNKSVVLNLNNPAERISVANPSMADILLLTPKVVQINGTSIGETTLIIWEKGNEKPSFFDLKVVGDQGVIDSRIKEMAPKDSIVVQYVNDTVVLSGNAANEQTRKKAEDMAKLYSPKVLNHITINDPQQVVLHVKVAQVDKSALRKLGVSGMIKGRSGEGFYNLIGVPNGSATGSQTIITSSGTQTSGTTGSGTGISGNVPGLGSFNPVEAFTAGVSYFPGGIGAVLQALTTRNLAKVLAEPNLLVKSGQKGEFLAGSKIPYQVVVSTGGTAAVQIQFIDVGIKLNFAPEVMENGTIALKIEPAEVSTIQGTLAVNGYPIIDTRTVKTFAELKDGESLVLAGLLSESEIKTMSKIPILGDIPILGALFRSTSKDIEEKELVFFITPNLVQPAAPGVKIELPTDKKPTPQEEKEMQWMPRGN